MASAVKTRAYRVGKTEPISQFSWQVAANIAATGPSYIEVAIARLAVIREPFLIVEGVLQHQEGVLSVRAERIQGLEGGASVDAHDFY